MRVASVPGLTLLKLAARVDRGLENNKDPTDSRLLTTYADAGNADRLYDHEMDLLETVGFDMELAGAELLGRDVATICQMKVLHQMRSLLTSERSRQRLASHMVHSNLHVPRGRGDRRRNRERILSWTHERPLGSRDRTTHLESMTGFGRGGQI